MVSNTSVTVVLENGFEEHIGYVANVPRVGDEWYYAGIRFRVNRVVWNKKLDKATVYVGQ